MALFLLLLHKKVLPPHDFLPHGAGSLVLDQQLRDRVIFWVGDLGFKRVMLRIDFIQLSEIFVILAPYRLPLGILRFERIELRFLCHVLQIFQESR